MSIGNKKYSPTKTQIQQPINPQYLNFIRKNHLKFQLLERSNSRKLLEYQQKCIQDEKMVGDNNDNTGDYQNLNNARRQLIRIAEQSKQRVFNTNDDLSPDEKELMKNYKTINVLQQNSYHKYLNLGQTTIVPIKRLVDHNSRQQNDICQQQQQQQKIQSSRVKSSIQQMKKQITQKLLANDLQSQKNHPQNDKKDRHFSTQTPKMTMNDKKAASEIKFTKTNNDQQHNRSPLLMKKQQTRDLWKEKFLNWNYGNISAYRKVQKKNPHNEGSDIKFPSINITRMENNNNNNRDRVKSNTQDIVKLKKKDQLQQLDNCNLIRNSKPKPGRQYQQQVYLQYNSLPIIPRSQEEADEFIKKHIESGLLKRQSSIRNYQSNNNNRHHRNHSQLSSSMFHSNPSSVSVMKRKRNATTHKTTGISQINMSSNLRQLQFQTQQKKKPKNYKQIARQKQKQVEEYLLNISLLKSSKILNFYQKQQEKNKLAFDKKHQSQLNIVREASMSLIQRRGCYTNRRINDDEKKLLQKQIADSQDDCSTELPMTDNNEESNIQHSTLTIGASPLNLQKKKGPNINTLKKQYDLSIYQVKIRSYREFIFMMNLAHKLVINIGLKPASQAKGLQKYTYFIGNGNNRLLVKSLMNRRYWWQETKDMNKANFVWTQLKVNELYRYEKVSEYASQQNRFDKLQSAQESKNKKDIKKKNTIKNQSKVTSYKAPLPENHQLKIFTKSDKLIYDNMIDNISDNPDNVININMNQRLKFLPTETLSIYTSEQKLHEQKLHNHLEFNYFIGNKKALFYNLQNYYTLLEKDVFKIIPYTLHIKKGVQDPAYKTFLKEYKRIAKDQQSTGMKNIWIVKPGQLSNRGQGITVIDQVYELNSILKKKQKHRNGIEKSYILQKYIQKPLLYKNRKFDIRHYVLLTRFHGRFRAYFYGQGYIRTSSHEYKLDELDEMIHLTNDAIQNKGQSYGKHQDGNKVSYSEFQRYLDSTYGENKHSFAQDLYPKMKNIALDAIKATYSQLDPSKLEHNFELLGLDFMIDNKFNLWLIQVNTNPCLQLSSKLLERLIPQMAEHTLRLCIDPMFPPPAHFPNSLKHMCPDSPLERMQYELIFDQARDGHQLQQLFKKCNLKQLYKDMGEVDEQDATFENDGREIQLKNQKGEDNQ